MPADIEDYREYVTARMETLRRTAYLLCGNWHTADDLTSVALVKLLRHWKRVSRMDNPDAYVRQVLLRSWLDEKRRPWRREAAWAEVPDRSVSSGADGTADRMALEALLAELPPRRRAVLVLRYFCDLSVEETARELGCTEGTVKSQTARALKTLQERLRPVAAVAGRERVNG